MMSTPDRDNDFAAILDGAMGPTDADVARLHAHLAARADAAGLLDVAYRTVETPVGTLLLAATLTGLVRVAYEREGFEAVLENLAEKVSPRLLKSPTRLDPASRQLEEYFDRRRRRF